MTLSICHKMVLDSIFNYISLGEKYVKFSFVSMYFIIFIRCSDFYQTGLPCLNNYRFLTPVVLTLQLESQQLGGHKDSCELGRCRLKFQSVITQYHLYLVSVFQPLYRPISYLRLAFFELCHLLLKRVRCRTWAQTSKYRFRKMSASKSQNLILCC